MIFLYSHLYDISRSIQNGGSVLSHREANKQPQKFSRFEKWPKKKKKTWIFIKHRNIHDLFIQSSL